MNKLFNMVLLITLLAGASLLSCADSESKSSLAGDAMVIINLGLPPEYEAGNASIIDRVLRFFSSDAVAAPAPAVFSSINIRVTGDGIGSIAKDFPSAGVISMTVPGGGLRTFEVTAQVAPGDPSAALTFYGSTMANVPSGETVSIPILMSLNETKLLVPDLRNQRLVLLDSVSPAGWNSIINTTQLGTITGGFYPFDIDYDSRGRIYIANWTSGTDIIRIDDINGTNPRQFNINIAGVFDLTNVIGIAIDRKRDILYCISSTDLFAIPLGNIENSIPVGIINRLDDPANAIFSNLYGIDVDDDGNLYIVNGPTGNYITKYNPDTDQIIYQSTFSQLSWGYDIKVKKPFIYVGNSGGLTDYLILKYRIDTENEILHTAAYTIVEHFGTRTASADLSNGMFYGPRKFVAIRNDGLYIIDNNETGYLCKMVGLGTEPSLGSSWSAFGAYGPGASQFKFYCSC